MRTPVAAILWENWRLTRVEAAWKLAVGLVGALAALVAFAAIVPGMNPGDVAFDGEPPTPTAARNAGVMIALVLIVVPNVVGWFSINMLTVARPGFPFALHYTRPVRTAVLVGVPMAYMAAVPAASYLVSALLLRVISGYPFPLAPVAVCIVAINLAHAPTNWPIRNTAAKLLANMAVAVVWVLLAGRLVTSETFLDRIRTTPWPAAFDVPPTGYALIVLMGLASFGVTVVGVARQRHGDAPGAASWTGGAGFPEWLVTLFRIPCPTSSPARAQVWFDLKSRGLPVLAIGAVLAIVNPVLFAASVPAGEWLRVLAVICGMSSLLAVLTLGGNAFGLRWRPGGAYASTFEVTQPSGTARLAGLKVLVRSVCMLAALVAVGVSVWASLSLIAVGEGDTPLTGYEPLRSWQVALESLLGALTGYQQVALAVVASVGLAVMVTSLAALRALAARYPRPLGIVGGLLLLHGLVLVPLVMTGYRGVGSLALWELLVDALVWLTRWIDAPAIVLATAYVSWRAFAERLLTLGSACGALLVSAVFGAAWVMLLRAAGAQLAEMPPVAIVWLLSPVLLPLMATVLAPWSLSRIRHT